MQLQLSLDPAAAIPLYIQLYQQLKAAIEQIRLPAGARLPSIRKLAITLGISKTTVEKAYQQLVSEGYIDSRERSRYIVNTIAADCSQQRPLQPPVAISSLETVDAQIRYDLASGEMDAAGFDFMLWKRCINKVFVDKERLLSYGNNAGEIELRQQIAAYLYQSRGVTAAWQQIIIGAGGQNLLHTVASLLQTEHHQIAFEDPGFKTGRQLMADHDFISVPLQLNPDGLDVRGLYRQAVRLVYVSPSHQFPTGQVMTIGQRNQLLHWADQTGGLIIEDDYDSEFRYQGRPIPALKGLDRGQHVIYLGSFSKVLPPSIRISYMILPDDLLRRYQQQSFLYKQTASSVEQLALARYMAEGQFERQIRRLRKHYQEKGQQFFQTLTQIFGDRIVVNQTDSGIYTIIQVNSALNSAQLVERALKAGCRVIAAEEFYLQPPVSQRPQIMLYFSKIAAADITAAITALQAAWFT